GGHPRLLVKALASALRPFRQLLPEQRQVLGRRLGDAEMNEGEPVGAASLDLLERPEPGLDVELRRWTHRLGVSSRLYPYAGRGGGVQRPVVVQVADVMRGVARGREALEPDDSVADDLEVPGRHGRQLAPEDVERVSVQAACARFEPARVEEVGSADL